ncbi:ABC transporter ATP-binding protein [Candidatus Riflebacteria bacterium]
MFANVERETVIDVRNLTHHFGDNRVLHNVNLEIKQGETLVVLGGSGCGKSTFMRILVGLTAAQPIPRTVTKRSKVPPPRPEILVFGEDVSLMGDLALNEVRKNFGMLFQSSALFASMTIGENVALPLIEHKKLHPNLVKIMVNMKLGLVGLGWNDDWREEDQFVNKRPSQLSGGQKKRAGLARALIMEPKILFFDEPSAGLDPIVSAELDEAIHDLKKAFPMMTMIVVTHEMKSAFTIADRMIMFDKGRIIAQGTPASMEDLIIFDNVQQIEEVLDAKNFEEAIAIYKFQKNPGCAPGSKLYKERVERLKHFFQGSDYFINKRRKENLIDALNFENSEDKIAHFKRVKQFFEGRAGEQQKASGDLLRHLTQ